MTHKHIVLYGIRQCDTVKKAQAWLEQHDITYKIHDYKKDAVTTALLDYWMQQIDWSVILNRAGTTFRKLPEQDKIELDKNKAISLMLDSPSMIKRPIIDVDGQIYVGFKPDYYKKIFY